MSDIFDFQLGVIGGGPYSYNSPRFTRAPAYNSAYVFEVLGVPVGGACLGGILGAEYLRIHPYPPPNLRTFFHTQLADKCSFRNSVLKPPQGGGGGGGGGGVGGV